MFKLSKALLVTMLLISQTSMANAESLSSMIKSFSERYVVPDSIDSKEAVHQRVIDDLKNDHTHCDASQTPKLVDLIITDSAYGPNYGQRTFYVDVYYYCS